MLILKTQGFNTTIMIRSHNGTIPSLPQLGSALSLEIQVPKLKLPRNPKRPDGTPQFIIDATVSKDCCHVTH
jgi:hypothetical protein